MRALAVACTLGLLLVTTLLPAAPAAAQSGDPLWAEGQRLLHRGDYTGAAAVYARLAARGPQTAPRARLLQARVALAGGDPTQAEAFVQQLLSDYPGSDQTAAAFMTLAVIRRSTDDCAGVNRALDAYEVHAGKTALGPYVALVRAQCADKLGDWSAELASATAGLAIEGGGPRLTKIELYERVANAQLQLGQPGAALAAYNESLTLAGTPAYRAEMLYTTARLMARLGQETQAADRLRAVVVDYADQPRAPTALDALAEQGRGSTVSPLQAARVRFNGGQYTAATILLDQVPPGDPDWGAAQVLGAEARLKLGDEADARAALNAVATSGSAAAGSAWLRLGQLDERADEPETAETDYLYMAQAAPERVAEAMFHVGFTRYVRGDPDGAWAAWQTGQGSGPTTPTLQAQLLYWMARASGLDTPRGHELLTQAAAAAPESYYGLRAQEQLGTSLTRARPAPSGAWLSLSTAEVQERDAWLASLGTSAPKVAADLAALPGLARAETLFDYGLRAEASWEIDAIAQQYAATRDVGHLNALADWLMAHDQPQLTMRVGRQLRDLVGYEKLPRAARKQAYPAGWGDLVAEHAIAHGVDPLLLLAMIRQESSFDPRAQSSAEARGLTQVVPATGRSIARQLGLADFTPSDLFKPEISVEFGSWFAASLLNDYQGRVFPALIAYNAGGGTLAAWLRRYGDDPDLLMEQIPYTETQAYLRIVYDNYWHYRHLYAGD